MPYVAFGELSRPSLSPFDNEEGDRHLIGSPDGWLQPDAGLAGLDR